MISAIQKDKVTVHKPTFKIVFSALLHLLGIAVIFVLFSSVFLSTELSLMIYNLLGDAQIGSQIAEPLLVLLGLSAAIWTLGVFLARSFRRAPQPLTRTRGSIMTETLIVLPVFLLFTSGLAQMGMNSMAGLLTTLGAFEAGRTVAVWGPEIGKERIDGRVITNAIVTDRARIAVAAIVTPVARDGALDVICERSDAFNQFRDGMGAALSPVLLTAAATPALVGSKTKIWSFSDAFGSQSFLTRGSTKLQSAYCSVSIEGDFEAIPNSGTTGGIFTVEVAYQHRPVFAYVQRIFDNSEIKREYTMRSHLPPNDVIPEAH